MNEQDCINLTILENSILSLEQRINSYVPRDAATINAELASLLIERDSIQNQTFTQYQNVTINEADRLKALAGTGLNFDSENWKKHAKILSDNGVNLNKPDWKDVLKTLGNKLFETMTSCEMTAFAAQQWAQGIINVITTVISFPINILVSFIKKLMDFVTTLLGIPLNPTDIPEWAKGIINKFKELIEFILLLPTLLGITNLLMNVIDSILPGFMKFIDMVKLLIGSLPNTIRTLKDYIAMQQATIASLRSLYEKEKRYLTLRIKFLKSQLDGSLEDTYQKELAILLGRQRLILSQLEDIKTLAITANPILKAELLTQHEKYCKMLTDLEKEINDLKPPTPATKEDIQKEINELQYRLDHLDEKYSMLFEGEKSLKESEEKLKELENQQAKISEICSWNKNIDEVMAMLKDFMEGLKNQENPFEKQAEFLANEVIQIKDEIAKLNRQIAALKTGGGSVAEANLQKQIDELNKQIKAIEDEVCATQTEISLAEVNDRLADIQALKKLRDDAQKALDGLKARGNSDLVELEAEKVALEDRLAETDKLAKQASAQSLEFNKNLNIDLDQFPEVMKWFPVATNFLCNLPKMIVNIIIAILNGVGSMTNLPDLWNIPYVP